MRLAHGIGANNTVRAANTGGPPGRDGLHGAKGAWQRGVSALMIAVSLAGVLIAFGADTLYQANVRGTLATLDPALVATAIWGIVLVIGANVAAVTVVHLTDPLARRAQAEEEARDHITEAALAQIASNAETLAAELAPQLGAARLSEMRAQYSHALPAPQSAATLPATDRLAELEAISEAPRSAREVVTTTVKRSRNGRQPEVSTDAPKA